MPQIKSIKNGTTVRFWDNGSWHTKTIKRKSYGVVHFDDGSAVRSANLTAEVVDSTPTSADDIDIEITLGDDGTITSREDAATLAKDRIDPFVWQLRQRIEGRITTEWLPGEKLEFPLSDMEAIIAKKLGTMYEIQGWNVKMTTRAGKTILVIS